MATNHFILIILLVAVCLSGEARSLSQEEITACVGAHNKLRELHVDTPKLQWDATLAAKAQAHAEYLVALGRIKHSYKKGIGENIYYAKMHQIPTCAEASQAWYKEINDYNYNSPEFSGATGHFTQLVWKDTKYIGVGIATSNGYYKKTYIVAQYSPQGNKYAIGREKQEFSANVKQRRDGCNGNCAVPKVTELDPLACRDKMSLCSEYKSYCLAWKVNMEYQCPKTCEFC